MPDQHKPGPATNALVAEKVMGWEWCPPYQIVIGGDNPPWPSTGAWKLSSGLFRLAFCPSTRIATAWEVRAELRKRGWFMELAEFADCWRCTFVRRIGEPRQYLMNGDTEHLSICLAALAVVESEADDASND